jgi:hypothetical protein
MYFLELKSLLVVLRYSCPCQYYWHRSREEVCLPSNRRKHTSKRRVTVLIQCPSKRSSFISFHGTRKGDYNRSDDPIFRFFEESRVLLFPFNSLSDADAEAGDDDDDPDRSFIKTSGCLRNKK